MVGDKGQPCRVPFDIVSGLNKSIYVYTCPLDWEYNAKTADKMDPVNL